MTNQVRTDPDPAQALGHTRSRVWTILQEADQPLGVIDMAARVGLHSNTARFHLDGLVEAGMAERTAEDRAVPGRPRTLYAASPGVGPTGRRSYRLLAEILAGFVASDNPDPQGAAQQAGDAWGRYLADKPAPFQRPDPAAATGQLVAALDDVGFAPEAVAVGRKRSILLHQCPFREVAERHQDVVCSIHLGLMQGLLNELDAPVQADRLDPFVEPSLCVAHLSARPGPGAKAKSKPVRARRHR